jgi:hypothetical protein
MIAQWCHKVLWMVRRNCDEQLQWRLSRHEDMAALRQARVLAEQELVSQLRKQSQQLAHELAVIKAKNNNQLAMVKTQCQQDLKDYQQYLQSLDRLKESLRNSYAHLPEAVAYTIHHHAKQLLNRMWEAEDTQQKMKYEVQLLQFMTAVHEDSQLSLQDDTRETLPKKSLAFIDTDIG